MSSFSVLEDPRANLAKSPHPSEEEVQSRSLQDQVQEWEETPFSQAELFLAPLPGHRHAPGKDIAYLKGTSETLESTDAIGAVQPVTQLGLAYWTPGFVPFTYP